VLGKKFITYMEEYLDSMKKWVQLHRSILLTNRAVFFPTFALQ
jgi:hypothetical protein